MKGIGLAVGGGTAGELAPALQRCASAGYQDAEFNSHVGAVIRGGQVIHAELARVRKLLAAYPLHYTVHAPVDLNLVRNPDLAGQVLDACLQLAAGVGAEVVVYHSAQISLHEVAIGTAGLPTADELQYQWEEETRLLRKFGARAADLGVVIALENRDPHRWEIAALARQGCPSGDLATYHQGMCLDRLTRQMEEIDSPNVGLCLDVGHAFLAQAFWGGQKYLEAIRQCACRVKHVHFHDNFGRLDDRSQSIADRRMFGEADCHMPPGWGSIPLGDVARILTEAGFSGWVVVELEDCYLERLDEALANTHRLWSSED